MKRTEQLKDLIKTQLSDGNWNYDPYMFGMANGMILALAVIEDVDPVYLESPDEWLCDKPAPTNPTVSSDDYDVVGGE
jgi:hypothetical protein